MRLKRSLFFTLILFFMIFSVSFVNASDTSTNDLDTNESMILSTVPEENILAENTDIISNEDSSSIGQTDESQNTGETENNENALILRASNDEFLTDETQALAAVNDETLFLGVDDNQILRAGTPHIDNYTFAADSTASNLINRIKALSDQYGDSGGAILYLNGHYFSGNANLNAPAGGFITIKNVKVVGGTVSNPNLMARFDGSSGYILNFNGYGQRILEASGWKIGYYSTSGVNLINVTFENLNSSTKLLGFAGGGTLDGCVVNNCYSSYQFIGICGCYYDNKPINVKNCNFTNCHQTYPGDDLVKDGTGQLGAVFGVNMTNCNFINTTSAQHGGALCIADESEWGSARVTSTLTDCSFINITSRWFAIYIHGSFKTSFASITSPEIINGCHFINCTGTGEYSGAIGISHDDLILKNSEFVNCAGGQGGAIMVGGIDRWHDAFSGNNTKGNNVTIENCNFTNNAVTIDRPGSYCIGIDKWDNNKPKDYSQYRYYTRNGIMTTLTLRMAVGTIIISTNL